MIHLKHMSKLFLPFARFSLFLVYFWFGILKVLDTSSASPMVIALLKETLPFITPATFLMGFGIFEMVIGVAFLIPKFTKIALTFLVLHMASAIMPLFMLPNLTWQERFIPT